MKPDNNGSKNVSKSGNITKSGSEEDNGNWGSTDNGINRQNGNINIVQKSLQEGLFERYLGRDFYAVNLKSMQIWVAAFKTPVNSTLCAYIILYASALWE